MRPLDNLRNIGISAHIDSGKTTLTERILFFTGIIHAMHEVRGKDGVGATMDHMELERERGITITSAATHCTWRGNNINIIDTPGHVDFTIEVERSLRVLDGAILILCGVAGVQSQSFTVDRQMNRYHVPRIAFINKLDRSGANPHKVIEQLRSKLKHNAVAMQLPIGLENNIKGVVDLVKMKAIYFEGENGIQIVERQIPDDLLPEAQAMRAAMLDSVSEFSNTLTELILEEKEIPEDVIKSAVRSGTLALKLTPVFMGSAFRNIGIQLALDAAIDYLPNPYEVENIALDLNNNEEQVILKPDNSEPLVAYAFKLEDGRFGQLTYLRIYQGTLTKGKPIINMTTRKRHIVGRLVRMHSNAMEEIETASAGDIIAMFGIDCATGTTFTNGQVYYAMTSMHVPDPVIDLVIEAESRDDLNNMAKGLNRFEKEDPTFKIKVDEESGQTIISGMGELHLDIYLERLRREYKVHLRTGKPQVSYREAITQRADFDYTHKKQTGGSGQFARVVGYIEPLEDTACDFEFVNSIRGGDIPKEYIPSCEKGFKAAMETGTIIGFPIVGVRCVLTDGAAHAVDSSDMAFRLASRYAIRDVYNKAKPEVLEPIMKVEVECPSEFQGTVLGNLNQRRGMITGTVEEQAFTRVTAEVPLSEMFGYATDLRSQTQGKAEFTMEFNRYSLLPSSLKLELAKKFGYTR